MDITNHVIDLPPVLGSFTRTRVVILVTGRTAVAPIGGMASVARHVATARRLGFDPIVLYPARMRALGAEIAGEIEDDAVCLPSDVLAEQAGDDADLALTIAADWYVSPAAIVAFNDHTSGPAVARFDDRGRTVAPVARMSVGAVRSMIPKLDGSPTAELIHHAVDRDATVVPLLASERHRLSDNVAISRCEDKLFASLGDIDEPWHVHAMHKYAAIPLTRRLAHTRFTPFQLATLKIALGLLAAAVLAGGGYLRGLGGAFLAITSRLLDAVSGDLARAAVRDGAQNERFDLIGDLLVQTTILWAVAVRLATPTATWLAIIGTVGIAISAWVSYRRVFRRVWEAQKRNARHDVRRDNYGSRFARRNGPAYGLVLAALLGRLDLFLWAAAITCHLFYLGWLVSERHPSR